MVKIAPSIMLADFCHLAEALSTLEQAGADLIHWDVMDGNFVPNLTFGAWIINQAREASRLPFDVHLMVSDPELLISQLSLRPGDFVVLHVEAADDPRPDLLTIKERGWNSGLAISPDTSVDAVLQERLLELLRLVTVMGVRPGFAGQTFIEGMGTKASLLRSRLADLGNDILIEVDGGVGPKNAAELANRGANILVAGNSIFNSGLPWAEAIAQLRG